MKIRSLAIALAVVTARLIGQMTTAKPAMAGTWFGTYGHWENNWTYYRCGTSLGLLWEDVVDNAAAKWSYDSSGQLGLPNDFDYYRYSYSSGQAYDHAIGLTAMPPGDLGRCYATTTGWPYWHMATFYIRFNSDEDWNPYLPDWQPTYNCMHSTALHELGHALGLSHVDQAYEYYTDVNRPTMHPYIPPGSYWARTLAQGDKDGMDYNYGLR